MDRDLFKEDFFNKLDKVGVSNLLWMVHSYAKNGFPPAKYHLFIASMLDLGYGIYLYKSKSTVSKYIYVMNLKTHGYLKVRFSNHKANNQREQEGESDVYVGRGNNGVKTTTQLIKEIESGEYKYLLGERQ